MAKRSTLLFGLSFLIVATCFFTYLNGVPTPSLIDKGGAVITSGTLSIRNPKLPEYDQDQQWDEERLTEEEDSPGDDGSFFGCFFCTIFLIFLLVVGAVVGIIVYSSRQANNWWKTLEPREKTRYMNMGYSKKKLYKMKKNGRLPDISKYGSPSAASPSSFSSSSSSPSSSSAPSASAGSKKACLSCGQMIDIRYSVCPYCRQPAAPKDTREKERRTDIPSKDRGLFPGQSPVIIQNIGEYIGGSKTTISDSVIQRSNIGDTEDEKRIARIVRSDKRKVLDEYKAILRHVWSDGGLSEGEKKILDHIRWRDEITMHDHRRIENEILQEMIKGQRQRSSMEGRWG